MSDVLLAFLGGVVAAVAIAAAVGLVVSRRYARLMRRTQRAERLAEMVQLTGGLAHEIKNPLSTIQLNLQLLQEDLPSESVVGSRVHARLRTVRQEASRLREILDDFLRYAGRMTLECEPTDLNRLVEEVADFFMPQAAVNRVQLRVAPSQEPVVAEIDPRLIKQAVLNLLLNATQAMTDGGELIVGLRSEPGFARIEVTDTGPGIAEEIRARLFEAYFTTKKSGTGLGLPMTKRIADEHGGSIAVASEIGRGSVFALRLPLKAQRSNVT